MVFTDIAKSALVFAVAASAESAYPQVKINEILYAPSGGAPEWVEMFNPSSDSMNVRNWSIKNKNDKPYTLTESDFYILPKDFLVITKSDTIFRFHPAIPSRVLICPSLPVAFMANSGDTISVSDSSGIMVDSVFYKPAWGGSGGKSLERISVGDSPFTSTNWGTCRDSSGSTPGEKNSIAAKQHDLGIKLFSAAISAEESECRFKLTVGNSGKNNAVDYAVRVFVDYNADHVPQAGELAASLINPPELSPGDSAELVLVSVLTAHRRVDACAEAKYDSDEDMTNNIMWTKLDISYPHHSLVVNEIMYAPVYPMPEWVELLNQSRDSVDLCGFTIGDNSNAKAAISGNGYMLAPGEFVVVADDSAFIGLYPQLSGKVLVAKIPSLNNSGDAAVIRDCSGGVIDSVYYYSSWGGNIGGKSLERILPGGRSDDPQNFETCTDPSGSTPCFINSVTPRDNDIAIGNIAVSPLSIQSGNSAKVQVNVLNVGLNAAEDFSVLLFNDLNINGSCEPNELLDSVRVDVLGTGDSTGVTLHTGALNYGTYHLCTLAKYPGDQRPNNNVRTLLLNVGLPPESVVINEIMYAPKPPEYEWIELYNTGSSTVDLSDFRIVTRGGSSAISDGSLLGPHDFAVLCRDSSVSLAHKPVRNLIIQPIPSLSNNGDGAGLRDNLGNLLDTMSYRPSFGGSGGKSLERVDYLAVGDSTNWHETYDSTGATPGAENSVAILSYDVAVKRIESPLTDPGVSEARTVAVTVHNAGRNQIDGVAASVQISSTLDESVAFSETRGISQPLSPEDTARVEFVFVPARPGTYLVLARASQRLDSRSRNDTLSALINVRYQPTALVINEIMYSSGSMGEYFEIFNASESTVDLREWTWHTNQSKRFLVSAGARPITPGGFYTIGSDSSILEFISDTGCVTMSGSLKLRDEGDCVVISDPSGNQVDSVCYLPSWHNADIAKTSGRSLERINPRLPSNDRTSWSTSVSQTGGTPGSRNSLFVSGETAAGGITVEPNPFSPDGDGHDDFTFINYSFQTSSVRTRVRIFDSVGRLIATPFDNLVLPSKGRLVWDGRDASGKIVRFGLYIMFVEVTGPDGNNLMTYKRPIVIAKRMR